MKDFYRDILPELSADSGFEKLAGERAVFLLGTDYYIGAPKTHEQRVAITPDQAALLKQWLAELGVELELLVVSDAGKNAGFGNELYRRAGAVIVSEAELAHLNPAPQVVHALKESTHYEATIPGPFVRIGALHSGDFKAGCGLADVLLRGNACGIFDGSAVGGFAYAGDFAVKPKFRIPLRSSMSVYAGWLAGEDVGESLVADETVVVSGGGVVGTSAVNVLLEKHDHQLKKILIIEKFATRCRELEALYHHQPKVEIRQGFDIKAEHLSGAKGFILTIFVQGSGATPKVVDTHQIACMKEGGVIVDVAIDEGGGIKIPKEDKIDPATGKPYAVTVEEIREVVEHLPVPLAYHADNHMPRRRPREASIEHGKTALMYLGALLYLCALKKGPRGALNFIMDHDYIEPPKTILDALLLDLKHGLAFTQSGNTTVLYRHVLKKSDEIHQFLSENGVSCLFA